MDNQTKNTRAGVIAIAVLLVGVVLFAVYANRGGGFKSSLKNSGSKNATAIEKSTNTSDLKLTVSNDSDSVVITNNEKITLTNCEVRLNPGAIDNGYTVRSTLLPNTPVSIPYESFTKNNQKFDINSTAVKNLTVVSCKDVQYRRGTYSY